MLAPAARAATAPRIVEVGWWTRATSTTPPDGGFAVGVAPDGPTSVAAIRLDLGATGVETATLRVQETGARLDNLAGVRVCYAATPWKTANGGPLTDAPAADCSNKVVSFGHDDAGLWSADITPFTAGRTGITAVIVVPDPNAGVTPGLPNLFDISFAPPALAATAVVMAVPPTAAPRPAQFEAVPPAGFFRPLTSSAEPVITPDAPDITVPDAEAAVSDLVDAPATGSAGRAFWRPTAWLRVIVIAALAGALAGAARWSVFSGPLAFARTNRGPRRPS